MPGWHSLFVTLGLSMVPLIELKGAIPVGMGLGFPLWEAFVLALVGSCLPVIPLLFFAKPIMAWLRSTSLFQGFVRFVDRKIHKNTAKVLRSRYTLWALFIFVAIPLPGTGIWSGSLIASFLGLRIRDSAAVIIAGNIVAGLAILLLSHSVAMHL